jgi:hypothetical protein
MDEGDGRMNKAAQWRTGQGRRRIWITALIVAGGWYSYYGYGSPMDAGTMIVAATAVPGGPVPGASAGLIVGPVRMHGIDPDTGQVRWMTDVGELLGP